VIVSKKRSAAFLTSYESYTGMKSFLLKTLRIIEQMQGLYKCGSSSVPAGNNQIQEMREVQRLRELPKIIILDLSGNPCSSASPDDYRLYVVFNVRKLKVWNLLA